MNDEKLVLFCKEAIQYILDNKSITDKECMAKFGDYYGELVFKELIRLKAGNQVGYGPVERNSNTISLLDYLNCELEKIRQKEKDALLDRQLKKVKIKYTKRAYIISIIAIFLSIASIIISLSKLLRWL
ncbi:MAG: hypothetical protein HDQ88_07235 [Clostridia bacterium]|nr:hypothetical protein [Clostridia bacterium]